MEQIYLTRRNIMILLSKLDRKKGLWRRYCLLYHKV